MRNNLAASLLERLSRDQKIRFLFVGGYNTAFGYLTFVLLYWLAGEWFHYVVIAITAHFLAVTNSFLTQRHFVFRSTGPWKQEFIRFQIAYLTTLPIGIGLLALFHDVANMPILLAQAVSLVVIVVISYIASSRFTFRRK